MVEREVDRARRTFGMFFEVFAQRGTAYAPALAAHDAIARDCYAAVRANAPRLFPGPLLAPITYLEHGYSPATMRRGVTLSRLLGETNPFPLIRIPWDRDRPWQAVFLHEVSHNLQADMGLWVENRSAVIQRLATRRAAAARGQHLRPLAQGDLRRPVRLPARRAGGRVGDGHVPRPPGRQGDDLPPRRAAPDRLPARPDPGRDGPPHGLRRRGAPAGRGLARAVRPEARPPHAARAPGGRQARDPRHRRRDRASSRGATWPSGRWPASSGSPPPTRRRSGAAPCCSPAAAGRPSCRRASWSAPAATRSRPAPTSRPCRG